MTVLKQLERDLNGAADRRFQRRSGRLWISRAWRVALPIAAVAAAVGTVAVIAPSEREIEAPTTRPDAAAPLRQCPQRAWAGGGGTDWEVAGVSCDFVRDFVFRHFEPHPGGTTQTAAGFTCRIEQHDGPYSALDVACVADDGRRFRFRFH
jgi:hypothetical protein